MANQEQLELLRQILVLRQVLQNQQREENSGEVDLSVFNVSGADLSECDLSGTDFSEWDLSGTNFSKTDLSETNLSRTDLSEANLSGANLSGTDLRGANLSGANLSDTNLGDADISDADLSFANLSGIDLSGGKLNGLSLDIDYLSGINLRGLNLSNLDLSWIDFDNVNFREIDLCGIDFKGVNLSGTDLSSVEEVKSIDFTHMDFSDADLSNADLRGMNLSGIKFSNANLSGVNFAQVQALGTNFMGAILTGACIEDWNTNSQTELDGVICEYVYLKQKQQERRPSSGSFKPGGFTALLQKALDTVDLIFADGIDWQAFFQSFQELRSQYDDLSIQAIEKKSGGAFVVRLEVPLEADKAAIERQAKELYEIKLQFQEQCYRAELQAKDGQITVYREQLEFHRQNSTNLMEIVKTMAEKEPSNITNDLRGANIANFANQVQDDASQSASSFTQTINSNIDDITKIITALRDTAQTFPEAQREAAFVHLEDLQEDLSQPEKQKPQRIKTRLVALFAIASTASGVVVGATDFGNKVLDLSKKLGIELVHPQSNQQLPPAR